MDISFKYISSARDKAVVITALAYMVVIIGLDKLRQRNSTGLTRKI